ncbi:MAG: IS5 family transposase [Chloroflexi bacterium]|nr:IS5 family transposase [Chloroflexota bacterium]
MEQPTFSDLEYQGKKRRTRREVFLERMDGLIPWQKLEGRINPFYPKAGRGRHPYPLPAMLRIHCVQLFYNLSDPGMEDLLYESDPVRRFVGLKLTGPLPDETTILNFRHLLEQHNLGQGLLKEINAHLESQGLKLREGTIVDATIIEAPSSTKNRNQERDPEMHQTRKGNQWHFGMKAHIDVDADTGIVHSMTTTAANAHDVTETHHLLHGKEEVVWGDAGYQGVHKREENLGLEVEWRVAMRPGRRRKLEPESEEALVEKAKASVRAKVEHPFQRLKRQFGYWKVRYRGLAKNTERLALLFGLGNLLIAAGQPRGLRG